MEWIVKNAQNVDVERQHLNKILKEIKSEIDKALTDIGSLSGNLSQTVQQLTTTIIKVINNEVPPERLVTYVTLTGDVVGTSVVVPGQNAVTISTELTRTFLEDAPIDANAYWRRAGQWEAVPASLYYLSEISGSGYAIWDDATLSWITRSIESADTSRIVVVDGDGVSDNTQIDLAEVIPSVGGLLKLLGFDSYGRRSQEDDATTDDLIEGVINLYWKEAPLDGKTYGRKDGAWAEITEGGQVPYFMPAGSNYVVQENKQVLYSVPIEFDTGAVLTVNGILVEVS